MAASATTRFLRGSYGTPSRQPSHGYSVQLGKENVRFYLLFSSLPLLRSRGLSRLRFAIGGDSSSTTSSSSSSTASTAAAAAGRAARAGTASPGSVKRLGLGAFLLLFGLQAGRLASFVRRLISLRFALVSMRSNAGSPSASLSSWDPQSPQHRHGPPCRRIRESPTRAACETRLARAQCFVRDAACEKSLEWLSPRTCSVSVTRPPPCARQSPQ